MRISYAFEFKQTPYQTFNCFIFNNNKHDFSTWSISSLNEIFFYPIYLKHIVWLIYDFTGMINTIRPPHQVSVHGYYFIFVLLPRDSITVWNKATTEPKKKKLMHAFMTDVPCYYSHTDAFRSAILEFSSRCREIFVYET